MRIVLSVGGNALLKRAEVMSEEAQRRNIREAVRSMGRILNEHEVLITHGNGPQVGLLALQAESYKDVPPYGLDILGAESQAMVGYMLASALQQAHPQKHFVNIVTRSVVNADDPAFDNPTKFIGAVYSKERAFELAKEHHWCVKPDGRYWRRVVPSPEPIEVLEAAAIETLMKAGMTVIAAGGGGVPMVRDEKGTLHGVEAVIDKDLAASLLAQALQADLFLIATDVDAVYTHFGQSDAKAIHQTTPDELGVLSLPAGSMGPKVEAACRFVKSTGRRAAIGSLSEIEELLLGTKGTQITS